jgi:formate dehydrogenase beta subunit
MNAVQEIKWWKAARPKDMGEFGETVCIHIDCNKIEVPAGASVLNAATNAGVYIPALCAHPDLPPAMQRGAGGAGCNLCMIELEGEPGMRKACSTTVVDGMRITTKSEKIFKSRQESLAKILGPHPHVCLTCPQRDGCSRTTCSFGNPPETRCCDIFPTCELRKIADFVGIPGTTPGYKHGQPAGDQGRALLRPRLQPVHRLPRCLTACNDIRGVGCLEVKEVETPKGKRTYVGTIAETLVDSGCKFCQACVTVCPTGALTDRTLDPAKREESMVPCKSACPAGIDVPRYVQLAAEGKYGEAIAVVREKLPFPGIVGRACFAMCEAACRRQARRPAVDPHAEARGRRQRHRHLAPVLQAAAAHRAKAAVIGAGPAGLTVAWYLAKKGHAVTVFDAQPSSGGMARYGIPSYRVPGEVIDREVGEVEKLGVKFQYDTRIENMDDLFAQGFEAAFIGIGCQGGDKLGIPGDDLPGVVDSPTYLRAATMGLVNTPGTASRSARRWP